MTKAESAATKAGSAATKAKSPATKADSSATNARKPVTKSGASSSRRQSGARHHHHVYVVELQRDVLYERRFRDANPNYDGTSPCVYVGMTGLTPERRFANHKAGVKGNRYVLKYGLRLRPDLYAFFNPMPFNAAGTLEYELAEDYRALGWAVWQA